MSTQRQVKVELVTPARARELLKKNSNNRHISERAVNHYIRQIKAGEWQFNGDTIRIAEDGTLLDGQHRLEAIIKTGHTLECIIVYGLKKTAMMTIDSGRSRKVADYLKIIGIEKSNPIALGAVCSVIFKFRDGVFVETSERQTTAEAIEFIEKNKAVLNSMKLISNKPLIKLLTPSVTIALHFLFSKIDKLKSEEFFEKLTTGENLGATSPILKLRSQLISMKGNSKRRWGKISQRTFIYYACTAFEGFLHNRRIEGHYSMMPNAIIELPRKTTKSGK